MIDGSEKRNRQLAFELQNSHVCEKRSKRRWSFKVRITVYNYYNWLGEFARNEFINLIENLASLSLAERWTITEIRWQLNSVLTYSMAHRCPLATN